MHYKTTSAELLDVVGGHIPLAFVGELGVVDYVNAGRLKILAIASDKRSASLPATPTFAELGFSAPELHLLVRINLWAKAGTSSEVRGRLRAAVAVGLKQEGMQRALTIMGAKPLVQRSEDDIERHLKTRFESNGVALRSVGLMPQ